MLKVFDINKSTNGGKNPLLDACPNFQRYIVTTPLTLLDIPQLKKWSQKISRKHKGGICGSGKKEDPR